MSSARDRGAGEALCLCLNTPIATSHQNLTVPAVPACLSPILTSHQSIWLFFDILGPQPQHHTILSSSPSRSRSRPCCSGPPVVFHLLGFPLASRGPGRAHTTTQARRHADTRQPGRKEQGRQVESELPPHDPERSRHPYRLRVLNRYHFGSMS